MPNRTDAACRYGLVLQAVARLRARGVEVNADVMALYGRYLLGVLSREQVGAAMAARAEALRERIATASWARRPKPCPSASASP